MTPTKTEGRSSSAFKARLHEAAFAEVVQLIEAARQRAYQAVNTSLIDLHWQVGEYISRKLETAAWGEGVVAELARYIQQRHPNLRGFTRASLFRMRQFYDTYRHDRKVAPLVRQLPWSHNLIILGRCKRPGEREFYLRMAFKEHWGKRQLECQLRACLFERVVLNPPIVAPALRQIHPEAIDVFKDAYLVEFLQLPDKKLLQAKLHEFYTLLQPPEPAPKRKTPAGKRNRGGPK